LILDVPCQNIGGGFTYIILKQINSAPHTDKNFKCILDSSVHFYDIIVMRILFYLIVFFLCSCVDSTTDENNEASASSEQDKRVVNTLSYNLTNIYPHDTLLFTEGLLFNEGRLLESTGSPDDLPQTKSMVGITDLKTGKFQQRVVIDRSRYFGEGIVVLNNKIYQLTYQNQLGFIYDAKTYKRVGQFSFKNKEGWGMTHDSVHLIMSDGTNVLTFLDTATLSPVRTVNVLENNLPVEYLNELEYVKGFIYANVFTTNTIVKIDAATGRVVAKLDLTALYSEAQKRYGGLLEMNGIAYDQQTDRFYVTGKFWPCIFELSIF
jgi:glutaminyl-peptide cyclotransferase